MAGSGFTVTSVSSANGGTTGSATVHKDAQPGPPLVPAVDETYNDVGAINLAIFLKAFDSTNKVDTSGANGSNGGNVTIHH